LFKPTQRATSLRGKKTGVVHKTKKQKKKKILT